MVKNTTVALHVNAHELVELDNAIAMLNTQLFDDLSDVAEGSDEYNDLQQALLVVGDLFAKITEAHSTLTKTT